MKKNSKKIPTLNVHIKVLSLSVLCLKIFRVSLVNRDGVLDAGRSAFGASLDSYITEGLTDRITISP